MVNLKLMSALTMNLALLHEGGLDELAFVAVGLLAAWAIIAWTGRSRDDAEEEDDEDPDDSQVATEEGKDSDREAARRPTERQDDE